LVRTSVRRHLVYIHVQSSISFYSDDNLITAFNVTFYLTQNLNRRPYSLTSSKCFEPYNWATATYIYYNN